MQTEPVVISGRHALVGNKFFSNLRPNLRQDDFNSLRHLPTPEDAPRPTSVILGNIWDLHWIRPEAPFMLLVPVDKRPFHNALFHRLHYTRDVPLVRHPEGGWCLRDDVLQEWFTLEANLHAVWWAMLKTLTGWQPQKFRYWAWPHRYGYRW